MTKKPKTVTAYKAFDANWKCRDFQYEVGKTYEMTGDVELCSRGFHACTIPADVWTYYDITDGKIARVTMVDPSDETKEDSKIVSAKITIEAEISMPQWIVSTVDAIKELCGKPKKKNELVEAASGYSSKLAASGYSSTLAASGDSSKLAASGDSSTLAAAGDYSKLAASGHSSKLAASGYSSTLAAAGDYSKLAASGDYSTLAASGDHSTLAASGDYSKLAASGDYSKLAASGDSSTLAASGKNSFAMAAGVNSRAKAANGGAIAIAWRDGQRARIAVGHVGEDGIKADTWYEVRGGKLAECA